MKIDCIGRKTQNSRPVCFVLKDNQRLISTDGQHILFLTSDLERTSIDQLRAAGGSGRRAKTTINLHDPDSSSRSGPPLVVHNVRLSASCPPFGFHGSSPSQNQFLASLEDDFPDCRTTHITSRATAHPPSAKIRLVEGRPDKMSSDRCCLQESIFNRPGFTQGGLDH